MAKLSLININKSYENGYHAVKDVNLEIDDKEFVVLVGPSGCGKSTTLRMIAGIEDISSGELYIGDKLVNEAEAKDRDIAMVFQNYALYPHMSVYENMAFALKLKKVDKKEIDKRVKEAAKTLSLEALLDRKPKELSGGQRQRVALGRSIVREPKVFLMDEPLSNLDAKLRVTMRTEISKLHKKLNTTFIYVTHDQTEAMTMGTKIVVMKDGVVQQIGSPMTIYEKPANMFVASFIGSPQMNFIDVNVIEKNYRVYGLINEKTFELPKDMAARLKKLNYVNKTIKIGVRPEHIYEVHDVEGKEDYNIMDAQVEIAEHLGSETYLRLNLQGCNIIARVGASTKIESGCKIKIAIDTKCIHMFDIETEKTIF
ncbi:sn-glycerol-3-phosphate ABC transporter ATP-binding protein UgpC [Clostridium sp. P21]|uniref:sn-glycerol-3-phosphate ABC transporter ATP-binding protein UgpC n=1 Tax=Clostridium muellerianum TaxID=2716538 RepID=A0A7Y0EKQ8_9CLOT|nr:sn-glycerol-3-phosphate ABC transporter ATP-binding protein UgpC [Clostridium muellerianum]NMM65197.1 sn-glycerol-3-phosphate ABC transporter ATP-binding protein UgpC [Clostridium muellerianum]